MSVKQGQFYKQVDTGMVKMITRFHVNGVQMYMHADGTIMASDDEARSQTAVGSHVARKMVARGAPCQAEGHETEISTEAAAATSNAVVAGGAGAPQRRAMLSHFNGRRMS